MSHTAKLLARFWQTMTERYGTRWTATYNTEPTEAWKSTLSPFSPKDIAKAIELLDGKEHTRQHPPTEPEFRALLKQAGRMHLKTDDDPSELRRGYWRSTIIHGVAQELGYSFDAFEPVLISSPTLGQSMRLLLDEVEDLEVTTGQRTHGQESMCRERIQAIGVAFKALKAAQQAA